MRSRCAAPLAALALLAAASLGACSGDDSVGEVPVPAPATGTASGNPVARIPERGADPEPGATEHGGAGRWPSRW